MPAMDTGPTLHTTSRTQQSGPSFTFGAQAIPRTRRGWDRAPRSPRKNHRKGTKVWKRQALASQDTDGLVSAQLLGDLAASVTGHAAKRQRVEHMPAVPVAMQKKAPYAPTMSDGNLAPKRKIAKRRKSTKSPAKPLQQGIEFSPAKIGTRRRSSIKPVTPATCAEELVIQDDATNVPLLEPGTVSEELLGESSFLDAVDLAGSTMFDQNPAERSAEGSELTSDDEASIIDGEYSEDDGEESELEEDLEAVDGEGNRTARLLDAGNTGVVAMPSLDEEDLDKLDDDTTAGKDGRFESGEVAMGTDADLHEHELGEVAEALDKDDADASLQENVSGLLATPPKEHTPRADDKSATPSPATEDESLKASAFGAELMTHSPTPPLVREETGSTVEFDEGFYRSHVMQVTKDAVFRSPENTVDLAQAVESPHPVSPVHTETVGLDVDLSTPQKPDVEETSTTEDSQTLAQHVSPLRQVSITAEDISDEESEDELFTGEPTVNTVVFSPAKPAAKAVIRSPSPRKTRAAPRLSDDTTYLNDFLNRVKAQAAARSQQLATSPVKTTTPRKSPRKVLEPLDANSPSPSPVKRRSSKETGSPIQLPKTPTAKMLLENTLSPDTPDELGAPAEDDGPRRSGRSRLLAPAKLTAAPPNAITFRRADGEPYLVQRSDAQKLAMATRANTRRNKGTAVMPKSVLEVLQERELSPMKQHEIAKNKKGQNVDWDNKLVYYLGDERTRSKRKAKELAEDAVEDKENEEADVATPMPKKKNVKITRTPRAVKPTSVEERGEPKPVETEKKVHESRLRKPRAGTVKGTPAAKRMAVVDPPLSSLPAPRRRTTRRV